jgi:RNA polymerase sigma-70 factor (ECF subfamily)
LAIFPVEVPADRVIYFRHPAAQSNKMTLCQEDIVRGLMADRLNLLAYIRAIVLNQQAAEDIHQEVLIQALQSTDAIADERHLLAWARRTAKFKAFEFLRKNQRQPQHLDPELLELLEPIWEGESERAAPELNDALSHCLGKLTDRSRQLVNLRFGECLSGSQISQLLGLKIESVYMAFSRIYRMLDHCVRQRLAALK